MSAKTVWLLMISGLSVATALNIEALAPVESRRGSSAGPSSSYANPEGGDRATRLLTQIEALKQEVGDLRGLVEVQDHEIKQLRKSQQDLYLDLDKRLVQVQQNQKGSPAKPPSLAKEKPKQEARAVAKPSLDKPSADKSSIVVQSAAASVPVITGVPNRGADSAKLPPPPTANASNKSNAEKGTYEVAYSLVRSKRYAEAITALQDYLARFPQGEQAPNAYYWLGEVYTVQWQADKSNTGLLDKASQAFLNLREEFPMHSKSTDALLKLGLIESDKGNFESARHYLTEVINRYPGTSAARIAETRLQQLM